MALKPDRKYTDGTNIMYFMNATGNRGGIVIHTGTGSGAAMDDSSSTVAYPTGQAPSGTKPAGLLLCDVVNLDLTRQHRNWHQDQVQLGGKVTCLRQGDVTTNVVATGLTINAGDVAYYNTTGSLTNVDAGSAPSVGRFLSKLDADGYARVEISL
jgi:hypothetical protein